jgi:hypothetical protein
MKLWRGQLENWQPTRRDKALVWLGIGAVFYVLALTSFASPSQSARTGRWGWLHEIFFGMFGASGDIILYSCLGTTAMLAGAWNFRAMQ